MDIGYILLRDLDDICWNALASPEDPHGLCSIVDERTLPLSFNMNSFIASLPQNPFVIHWHAIFLALWTNRTSCTGISLEPLLQHVPQFEMVPKLKTLLGNGVTAQDLSDYSGQMLSFSRLIGLVDPVSGFDGNKYWRENCRMFIAPEIYPFDVVQTSIGFAEPRQAQLLSMKRTVPIDHTDPDQADAEQLIEGTLAGASFKKLSSGIFEGDTIASLWNKSTDGKDDIREGTWAAYLRHGSVHFEQTRVLEPLKDLECRSGVRRKVWRVGVLEPIEPGKTELIEG